MSDDAQLLRKFVADHSQQAFASLVERHVNLVYSAALRQVGGDAHLAWDVSQGVFLALAQNAPRLASHAALTGWLFTTTRFICAKLVRSRQRGRARDQAASVMNEILHEAAPEPDWAAVRPILDATMHELSETDREALLLRHFDGRSFAEIGRLYGLSENAARMRAERALEKFRARLTRRGITSTAAALGAVLSAHGVGTAPAGLATAAASLSFASLTAITTGSAGTLAWLQFMSATNLKVGATAAVVALTVGGFIGAEWQRRAEPSAPATSELRQTREPSLLPVRNPAGQMKRRADAGLPAAGRRDISDAASDLSEQEVAVATAAQKAMATSVRAGLDERYGRLFRHFKLAPAELEKFRALLTERQLSSFDAVTAAQSQGVNLSANPGELKNVMERVRADVDESIRAFLGDQRYQQYQEFNRNAPSHALLDVIERQLSYTDTPLHASQSDSLLRVLIEGAAATPTPPSSVPGPLGGFVEAFSGGGRAPLSDESIARAQTILTPAQIEIVRQIQSEQRSQADALRSLGALPGVVQDNANSGSAVPPRGAPPPQPK
jgi:RNA polymerase sigma factor (sigma-70 family)